MRAPAAMRAAHRPSDAAHLAVSARPGAAPKNESKALLARARNAAYAEAAQGRVGHGLGVLLDALESEPMSHDLLSDMAALLLSAGKLDHAAAYAEQALQVFPLHGPSLYALGFALSGKGEIDRAVGVLTELTTGRARDSLLAEAPELLSVAQTELTRLQSLQGTDRAAA